MSQQHHPPRIEFLELTWRIFFLWCVCVCAFFRRCDVACEMLPLLLATRVGVRWIVFHVSVDNTPRTGAAIAGSSNDIIITPTTTTAVICDL